jgi:hypothetical protein
MERAADLAPSTLVLHYSVPEVEWTGEAGVGTTSGGGMEGWSELQTWHPPPWYCTTVYLRWSGLERLEYERQAVEGWSELQTWHPPPWYCTTVYLRWSGLERLEYERQAVEGWSELQTCHPPPWYCTTMYLRWSGLERLEYER